MKSTKKEQAGRPEERIRWTLGRASKEFDIDAKTLSKRMVTAGIAPSLGDFYSTVDITKAVFGDFEGERLRKLREDADEVAIRNAKSRAQLIPIDAVTRFCEGVGVVFRQSVLTSSMTEQEREDALANVVKLFDAGTVTNQISSQAG